MPTNRLLNFAEKTVKLALKEGADQAQATTFMLHTELTRFANSQIHQNVASNNGGILIKVITKKKIGTLRANTLEDKTVADSVKHAMKIARVTPANKDFKSLPEPTKWAPIKGAFDPKTDACTPDYRAQKVKEVITTAHDKSKIVKAVAGSFSTGSASFAVSNSLGVAGWAQISSASINVAVISEKAGSQGFGSDEQYSRFVKDIDHTKVAEKASENSVKSVKPIKMLPGEYEVVLSPRAVSTLVGFLGFMGFSATTYQDGESFVKYHLNEQAFDKKLTIKDDSRAPKTLIATPIDGEGVPKQAVTIIDNGVISEKSICYDSFTAGKEKGKSSTGHSVPPIVPFFGPSRPAPVNMIASPGKASIEDIIKDTKHGIYITRFHYTNPVNPTRAILTGLTRDGTFLIENGEITKPIMNLRYTDSMLSALKDIPLVGKELHVISNTTVPAMKLKKLRFTGVTEY